MGLYLTQILRLHKIVYYDGDFADMCHEKNSLKFIGGRVTMTNVHKDGEPGLHEREIPYQTISRLEFAIKRRDKSLLLTMMKQDLCNF